jgi:hypothetical protein
MKLANERSRKLVVEDERMVCNYKISTCFLLLKGERFLEGRFGSKNGICMDNSWGGML